MAAASDFSAAQAAVAAALRADGLDVTVEREGPWFARLAVTDLAAGTTSTVELGVDWRAYPRPERLRRGAPRGPPVSEFGVRAVQAQPRTDQRAVRPDARLGRRNCRH
jgi:hypothetical protein